MCIYNCACDPASAYELWNANNDVCRIVQFLTSMRLRNFISTIQVYTANMKHTSTKTIQLYTYSSYNSF